MEINSRIYKLLRTEQQSTVTELLRLLGITNPEARIKQLLDVADFEVLEYEHGEVKKIKKKTTGEIFEKGGKFYHLEYKKWYEGIYFDASLFGTYSGNSYYKNYVRAQDGGLYKLEEISISETPVEPIIEKTKENSIKIHDIMKELTIRNVLSTSICYDNESNSLYLDLDTQAKSQLYLYEDGTIRGRYHYENTIDLNSTMDNIIVELCKEFSRALSGKQYGNPSWFVLCKENNVKIETYI